MKSSLSEISERRERLIATIRREGYLSVSQLAERFQVSESTIRRDLSALQAESRVTRTYGGALSEYDARFASLQQREREHRGEKKLIAHFAASEIREGETVFLDAGSTILAVAESLAGAVLGQVRVVTNSLPAAETLLSSSHGEVHILGGEVLPHQLVVVGPGAGLSLSAWRFDRAFLSAEGIDSQGLWNSQEAISEFQRHVCGRSERSYFCIDSSKLFRSAPSLVMGWEQVDRLVSDAPADELISLGVAPEKILEAGAERVEEA